MLQIFTAALGSWLYGQSAITKCASTPETIYALTAHCLFLTAVAIGQSVCSGSHLT